LSSPVHTAKDKEELFRKFIDSVLVDHKMPYLHDVCLTSPLNDGSVMKSWISSAIDSNISNLTFCASPQIIPLLPQSLFSGCSLVELGLYMASVIDFPVASATYFPKLKVLCLHSVKFNLDNDSATNFISSCPVLEKLKISTYKEQCFRTLNVSSTCLKYFSLQSVSGGEVVNFDYVPKIILDAPALEDIHVYDFVPHKYEVKDLSSLVNAVIHLSNSMSEFSSYSLASCVLELLNNISNAESLSLSYWTIPIIFDIDIQGLPTFHKLTSLELGSGTIKSWNMLITFLKSCPILEELTINGFEFHNDDQHMDRYNDVPSCLISHIKWIKITRSACVCKVEDIGFFLANADYLEEMVMKGFTEGFEEILALPRASLECMFEFI
jgi:hypothetical protein